MVATKEQEYALLHPDEDFSQCAADNLRNARLWRLRFGILLGLFVSSSVILAGFLTYIRVFDAKTCIAAIKAEVEQPYSPATDEVEYINKWLVRDPDTQRFMGDPRPDLDEAWHELLDGTLIRVTGDELLRAGNATSIGHKDGGYVAGLGISHSLHCIKRLKQYIHPDYYYPSPNQDWDELRQHVDHCLEGLRQAIMCNADLSIYTLEWTSHSRLKPTVRVPQAHVCVNWDRIHKWMKGRAATNLDMEPPPPELYEKTSTA